MHRFYEKDIINGVTHLSEEESKHCARVLRCRQGDRIEVIDGRGNLFQAVLTDVSPKECRFTVTNRQESEPAAFSIHLGIAPTKNLDRMEWMIEKLSEIGVREVTFLRTAHAERRKMNLDRMERKVISALKQSGNLVKPVLNELVDFEPFISGRNVDQGFIAHVGEGYVHLGKCARPGGDYLILIGPEGDFSNEEVELATRSGFKPVSLGSHTLRTETAGFVACCFLNLTNQL